MLVHAGRSILSKLLHEANAYPPIVTTAGNLTWLKLEHYLKAATDTVWHNEASTLFRLQHLSKALLPIFVQYGNLMYDNVVIEAGLAPELTHDDAQFESIAYTPITRSIIGQDENRPFGTLANFGNDIISNAVQPEKTESLILEHSGKTARDNLLQPSNALLNIDSHNGSSTLLILQQLQKACGVTSSINGPLSITAFTLYASLIAEYLLYGYHTLAEVYGYSSI